MFTDAPHKFTNIGRKVTDVAHYKSLSPVDDTTGHLEDLSQLFGWQKMWFHIIHSQLMQGVEIGEIPAMGAFGYSEHQPEFSKLPPNETPCFLKVA